MTKKEIVKTVPVHLAWSPKNQFPINLVAGTAAQQLDASFSTSASIELYDVDLTGPSIDLNVRCAFKSDYRFHKLIWSNESDKNIIVGGCDSGVLSIYDVSQLIERQNIDDTRIPTQEDGLIACSQIHSGAVRALDFTLQKNLLATGASASEVYIWDLNQELIPIQQLGTAEPLGDIAALSSNKQVQHIITTAFATQCLVWDLRTSKSIIKLSDSTSNIRWKDVKWNPETGSQHTTQLCLASEEDQCPVIQMWDLRLAASPIKVFRGHEKGVLSLDWSDADPDLLISSGKDDKIIIWNLNTASSSMVEIVREIPLATEWNFEVNWCPRNPTLISSCSSNGSARIFTWTSDEFQEPKNTIADSFPGVNQYQQSTQTVTQAFNKAPKWLIKTSGVFFSFGGKLLSFGSHSRAVDIHQVVTEPNLNVKFKELENVMEEGDAYAHCVKKYETANDPQEKNVWNFIAGQFYGENFKNQMYTLLGVSKSTLKEKLAALNINDSSNDEVPCDPSSNISHIGPAEDIFNTIAAQQNSIVDSTPPVKPSLKVPQNDDVESAISDALLLGDLELAVDLCLKEDKIADAFVIAMSAGSELITKVQSKYFEKTENHLAVLISTIANEDWFNIVDTCDLSSWKHILAALLTYTNGGQFRVLCESLGSRLSDAKDESLRKNATICFILAGSVNKLIENWNRSKLESSTEIQDLVELGLVMREAMKARNIEVPIYGVFSKALLRYAELLASQGYLTEAYSYLGESNEDCIQEFKDRLMIALGLKTIERNTSYDQTNGYSHPQQSYHAHSQQYNLKGDLPSSYSNVPKSGSNKEPSSLPPMTNKPTPMFHAAHPMVSSAPSIPVMNHNPAPSTPSQGLFTPSSAVPSGPPSIQAISSQPYASSFIPQGPVTSTPTTLFNPSPRPQFNHTFNNSSPASLPGMPPLPPSGMSPVPLPGMPPLPPSGMSPVPLPGMPPLPPSGMSPVPLPGMPPLPPSGMSPVPLPGMPPLPPSGMSPVPLPGIPPLPPSGMSTIPPAGMPPVQRATPSATPPPSSQVPYTRPSNDNITQSRTKYVIDPSVRGGGYGNNASSMAPITQQPTSKYPSASYMPQNHNNFQQQSNLNNFYAAGPQPDINSYVPNSQMPGGGPRLPSQPEMPLQMLPTATAGQNWNNQTSFGPPNQVPNSTGYAQPNPTSYSMYGSRNAEVDPMNRPPSAPNVYQPNTEFNSANSRVQTSSEENNLTPNNYQNNVTSLRGAYQKQKIENISVPKPALPDQHIKIQTIFENLRNQCVNKTSNLQMKRKLDDTGRKLETLYDSIRDSKLSPRTLQGLHDIVTAIENRNYPECLSLHTQLVSGPDFSLIASFMPGIKVLVQSATQLNVYL